MNQNVVSLFQTMDYGLTTDCESISKEWLSKQEKDKFDSFLNNKFGLFKKEGTDDDPLSLGNAKRALGDLNWRSCTKRAGLLYKLAEKVASRKELFASVEADTTKKPLSRTLERDVPDLVRHLRAAAYGATLCSQDWLPHGVVGILVERTNSPSLWESWQLGFPLATGNSVVLCVTPFNCFSAFLLAETAKEVGFPSGILSVVCNVPGSLLKSFDLVSGSGLKPIRHFYSNLDWKTTVQPKVIVTETSDLASAAQGVLQASFYNAPMSALSGTCVLVQECIFETFWEELSDCFRKLRPCASVWDSSGDYFFHLDNQDQIRRRTELLTAARKVGAQVVMPSSDAAALPTACCPVLIRDLPPTAALLNEHERLAGAQVTWLQSFRHSTEAVSLANGAPFSDRISIWGERTSLLMEMVKGLRANTIWINCQNVTDAGEASFAYNMDLFLSSPLTSSRPFSECISNSIAKIDSPNVSEGCPKEVSKAISSARSALPRWRERGAFSRSQLLFSLAESMLLEQDSFLSASPTEVTASDVQISSVALSRAAACAALPSTRSLAVSSSSLMCWCQGSGQGVVLITVPNHRPLATLMVALASALAAGNTVIAILGNKPLAAQCSKILSSEGILEGVVTLLVLTEPGFLPSLIHLLSGPLDCAWLFHGGPHIPLERRECGPGGPRVLFLDLSGFDWDQDGAALEDLNRWMDRQATNVKQLWLHSGDAI